MNEMVMISGEEFERRIRRVSQLRQTVLTLRRAALEAWTKGTSPIRPRIDIRSDVAYWTAQIGSDKTTTD